MATQTAPNPLLQKMQKALALQKKGEFEKAQRIYKAVLKKAPNSADATHLLGVTYRQLGYPQRAFDLIREAIELAPDRAAFYANLARTMSDMEGTTPDSVLAAADKALTLNPNLVEALNLKAISLSKLDRTTEAEEILQHLIVQHPNYTDAYRNYGVLLRDNNDHDKALVFFNKAALLDPDNPENYIERARCRLVMKDYDNSGSELTSALEQFPDNGNIKHEVARLLFSQNLTHEGLAYAKAAVAENPDDLHRQVTLGVHLLMLNCPTEAIGHFKTARKLAPEALIGMDWNISLAYLALGNLKKGWALHPRRFDDKAAQVVRRKFSVDTWEGEDISDKTILVWADQGLGDALKAGTMLPQLQQRAGKIIVELSDKASRFMQNSFPDIQFRVAAMTPEFGAIHKDYDLHTNITDLARFFRNDLSDFTNALCPAYTFDKDRARGYFERLKTDGSKPIIGVSWRSRNLAVSRARFYLSVLNYFPIIESTDAIFVNLQYKCVEKEIRFLSGKSNGKFINFEDVDLFDDLDGAAALTACCDLVVSANTSVADMAGILDVPSIRFGQMEPALTLGQQNPPWYPSMKYMLCPADRPAAAFVPEIIKEVVDWRSTFSPERRNSRLGL